MRGLCHWAITVGRGKPASRMPAVPHILQFPHRNRWVLGCVWSWSVAAAVPDLALFRSIYLAPPWSSPSCPLALSVVVWPLPGPEQLSLGAWLPPRLTCAASWSRVARVGLSVDRSPSALTDSRRPSRPGGWVRACLSSCPPPNSFCWLVLRCQAGVLAGWQGARRLLRLQVSVVLPWGGSDFSSSAAPQGSPGAHTDRAVMQQMDVGLCRWPAETQGSARCGGSSGI